MTSKITIKTITATHEEFNFSYKRLLMTIDFQGEERTLEIRNTGEWTLHLNPHYKLGPVIDYISQTPLPVETYPTEETRIPRKLEKVYFHPPRCWVDSHNTHPGWVKFGIKGFAWCDAMIELVESSINNGQYQEHFSEMWTRGKQYRAWKIDDENRLWPY